MLSTAARYYIKGGVCNAVAFVAFVAETYDYGKRMNDYGK